MIDTALKLRSIEQYNPNVSYAVCRGQFFSYVPSSCNFGKIKRSLSWRHIDDNLNQRLCPRRILLGHAGIYKVCIYTKRIIRIHRSMARYHKILVQTARKHVTTPIYTNHFTPIHRKTNHYKETQIEFNYEIKDDKAKNNQILVMLSSFSTSYNVINISLVLPMRHTLKTFIGLCKNGIYF